MKPALAGIGVGLVGSAFGTQALRSLLFGISPTDPLTFVSVPLILLAVAGAACLLPASRAVKIDPTAALRSE
jgi:ABC-type antimicrobial peptide transport system permease subunit